MITREIVKQIWDTEIELSAKVFKQLKESIEDNNLQATLLVLSIVESKSMIIQRINNISSEILSAELMPDKSPSQKDRIKKLGKVLEVVNAKPSYQNQMLSVELELLISRSKKQSVRNVISIFSVLLDQKINFLESPDYLYSASVGMVGLYVNTLDQIKSVQQLSTDLNAKKYADINDQTQLRKQKKSTYHSNDLLYDFLRGPEVLSFAIEENAIDEESFISEFNNSIDLGILWAFSSLVHSKDEQFQYVAKYCRRMEPMDKQLITKIENNQMTLKALGNNCCPIAKKLLLLVSSTQVLPRALAVYHIGKIINVEFENSRTAFLNEFPNIAKSIYQELLNFKQLNQSKTIASLRKAFKYI